MLRTRRLDAAMSAKSVRPNERCIRRATRFAYGRGRRAETGARVCSPFTGNERSLGLDLMADPPRPAGGRRARDTANMVASGPIALVSTVNAA